ncbi:carbohydrate ABC transporter permease [Streptomyces sp. ODS28]|uniref:carbohydrate ABC transporter permease n=1 Tax=Streptomyces sp. ODS28 TaxID=3136688 RepID=UPI0031EB6097
MRRRTGRALGRAGQYAALACYLAFLVLPPAWLASTAFKGPRELGSPDPDWIPRHPTTANFAEALGQQPLLHAAFNSLLVAGGSAVLCVLLAAPAAYAVARFRSGVGRATLVWALVSQMFPLVLVIIPLFLVLKTLRLVDSLGGLLAVYVVWSLPFALWMLHGFVRAVPREVEEAAMVDGAGRWRTLRSVVLPLLAPGLAATLLFAFITAWNEFFFALVLLKSPEQQTMSVILTRFIGAEGAADLGPLAAAALLATLPSLLFFLLIQRRLTGGLLTGAVKG